MPHYVPFHTIVPDPIQQFEERFQEELIHPEITAREFSRRAREGNIEFYREIVARSTGFGFYHQAPPEPHYVITPRGEALFLEDRARVAQFYAGLSEEEKKTLGRFQSDLAELLQRTA